MKAIIFSLLLMNSVEYLAILNEDKWTVRQAFYKSGRDKRRDRRKAMRAL